MARKYPTAIHRHSAGSNTLFICDFDGTTTSGALGGSAIQDDIDNNDTYQSGIAEPISWWTNATDDPTQTKEGIDAGYTQGGTAQQAKGTFTFYTGEDNRTGVLYILAKA